jgi:hypothetical protein
MTGAGFLDPVMYPELVELRDQMVDNRNDVRRPESGRPPSDHDHAGGGNRLGHDVVCWHAILPGDGSEPGLDSEQLVLVLVELVLKLCAPQQEHAAKLAERDPVQQPSDLGKREPEFLQRHDPVDLSQLCCRVAAVSRVWVEVAGRSSPISS